MHKLDEHVRCLGNTYSWRHQEKGDNYNKIPIFMIPPSSMSIAFGSCL